MSVEPLVLDEILKSETTGGPVIDNYLELIKNVEVNLEVMVGETSISVGELYDLKKNSVLTLNRDVNEPFDIVLDGRVVASGTLAVVDDNFAIKIVNIKNES